MLDVCRRAFEVYGMQAMILIWKICKLYAFPGWEAFGRMRLAGLPGDFQEATARQTGLQSKTSQTHVALALNM